MTVGELRTILACYDDDTPVLDGKGDDLPMLAVIPATVDLWESERDADGNWSTDEPTIGRAVSIGRRF